ncbi:hypothetical protein AGDE_14784 [Angomonas deanei]|uniref:Uncharacterized protein n=1 Tax=Angomonas deanei TaxID=59799 RepID=A0A7G2CB33_9TRYP|nr:hypothetical protein AGDE_14784 [Angomonas deanei]CAD2216968.1 hypothetical protein, conserved [Angomonas deanei]|eukprot:EPY20231.1 hypothetical protein AGDE_14784 [Angomonas deanei]
MKAKDVQAFCTRRPIQLSDMLPPEMSKETYCKLLDELVRWRAAERSTLAVVVGDSSDNETVRRVKLQLSEKKSVKLQLAVFDLFTVDSHTFLMECMADMGRALGELNVLRVRAESLEAEQSLLRKTLEDTVASKVFEKDLTPLLGFQKILNSKKERYLQLEAEMMRKVDSAKNASGRGGNPSTAVEDDFSDHTSDSPFEDRVESSIKQKSVGKRARKEMESYEPGSMDVIDNLFNIQ